MPYLCQHIEAATLTAKASRLFSIFTLHSRVNGLEVGQTGFNECFHCLPAVYVAENCNSESISVFNFC